MDIREQIEKKLDSGGSVSSADVADFAAAKPADNSPEEALNETTTTERVPSGDALTAAASHVNAATLAAETGATIDITPSDKAAFTEAIINNTRMTLSMTRLGGKFRVTVRSRTVRESTAVINQIQYEARKSPFGSQVDQTTRLRSLLLVFHIAELNGVEYAPPQEPLCRLVTDKGEESPTWLDRADAWYDKGDAFHAILWECVKEFEDKYWLMVEQAKSADFWQPATSI